MSILIIAQADAGQLAPATLSCVTAAGQIGGEVDILVAGHSVDGVAKAAAAAPGVNRVRVVDSADYAAPIVENLAGLIKPLMDEYTHCLAPASNFGKGLIPYVAALCDCQSISDISEVVDAQTFVRPIYAGNVLLKVKSKDEKKFISVRSSAFDPAPMSGGQATVEPLDAPAPSETVKFIGHELSGGDRPELSSAKIVVSGGRGMQSGDNFAMLEKLADTLGAAVGASRAAVDAGFVPNDYQVGQTGKIVAPDLYLAVGISGAIQHLAGMKDSKVIVAINNDGEAPIFQVADYGWEEDLFVAVPALQEELEK